MISHLVVEIFVSVPIKISAMCLCQRESGSCDKTFI